MSSDHIDSPAFHRAVLKSESNRIIGLLVVLAVIVIYTIARGATVDGFNLLWIQTAALVLVMAHEIRAWFAVRRALRGGNDVAPSTWVLNVVLESQIPTISLFVLLLSHWMTPYQVLVAPAMLAYFLFIILSILRLSPSVTLLTGIMSALGYLFVTFYVEAKFQSSRAELGGFPVRLYFVYAAAILVAGIIAAAIAAKLRTYVATALREADLQHELDQVNHDLEIARSIQQGLLPANTLNLRDFEIAGWNQPADQTGGDYFDWQSLPDGRVAISLADATGHGIGPALVSASCRAYSRASLLAGADKNGLLDRLNSLLADDLSTNRFVTFAVLFLDPVNSSLKVLSAGHGPMLLYKHRSNEIESLEAHGIPLGMIEDAPYSNATEVSLEPGDLMAVITDGFYEWENKDGEQFGLKRLETAIRESHDCTAEEVIERLRTSVEKFCGGTDQQDDLTAVVLKRKL